MFSNKLNKKPRGRQIFGMGSLRSAGIVTLFTAMWLFAFSGLALAFKLSVDDITVNEGDGTATFTITKDGGPSGVTVAFTTVDGTAEAPSDYTAKSGILTFDESGPSEGFVVIAIIDDNIVEAPEVFYLNLTSASHDADIVKDQGQCTIFDNDSATFTIEDVTADEDVGDMVFTVSLDNPIDIEVVVNVNFTDGTATGGGVDYDSDAQQVIFGPLDTVDKEVLVAINDDDIVEATETFTVTLSTDTDLGDRDVDVSDTATGTILDNDSAIFTIEDVTANENVGDMVFTVSLDNPIDIEVVVNVNFTDGTATGGGVDYDSDAQQVIFGPLDTVEKEVLVEINDDDIVEATETFTVTLSTDTDLGDRSVDVSDTATGTILDNDSATVSITPEVTATEGNDLVFTVTLDNDVQDGFNLAFLVEDVSTTPSDYDVITPSPVAFAGTAGEEHTITVHAVVDGIVEAEEQFRVVLDSVDHAGNITLGGPATGIIQDGDTAVFTINDVSQYERFTPMDFTVSLSNPLDIQVVVDVAFTDGSAEGGVDYDSTPQQVTFEAGDTEKTVSVPITNNARVEPDKTFTVSLEDTTTSLGGRSADFSDTGTGTILNDDYTLTVETIGSGTVTSTSSPADVHPAQIACGPDSICHAEYNIETGVTLTPIPSLGQSFIGWAGDISGNASPYELTIDGDKNVTAHFTRNEDCVSVNQESTHGYGLPNGEWYSIGTYSLVDDPDSYVTLEHKGTGSVSFDAIRFVGASGVTIDNLHPVAVNYSGTWTETADAGCHNGSHHLTTQNGAIATITPGLTGDYEIQVRWSPASGRDQTARYCVYDYTGHVMTATRGGNGSMEYSIDGGSPEVVDQGTTRFPVPTGDQVQFEFTAEPGYVIDYVIVDGATLSGYSGETSGTYTFPSMAMDHSIEVGFSLGEESISCIPVNQRASGYDWVSLGVFRLPAGTSAYVTLTHTGKGSVSHDAIMFSPLDGGDDIIVDDLHPAPLVVFSEGWEPVGNENCYRPEGVSDPVYPDWGDPGDPTHHFTNLEGAVVTITPDLPETGEYEILVRWAGTDLRDQTAQYCVHKHLGHFVLATVRADGVLFNPESGVTIESNTSRMFNVLSGTSMVFTIHPDPGYTVQMLLVDGLPTGCGDSGVSCIKIPELDNKWVPERYTFSNIQYSRTIEVDFNDHGGGCDFATPMTCNTFVEGSISPKGDLDYFKFEFAGSGRYTFYTEGTTDTFGRLLDRFCQELAWDDDGGEDNNFRIQKDLDAGTYFIEVSHADPEGTGDYTLHLDCKHVIRAVARSGGNISPAGEFVVERGSSMTFNITPDSGNSIYQVLVNGTSVGDVSTYTFLNINRNHTIEAVFTLPPTTCTDISDVPLDALTRGVPPIIIFIPDDSGSMDWEFMTPEGSGLFANQYYVFDNPGDNRYHNSRILTPAQRLRWMSQWSGYNEMYYNPETVYVPWPTFPHADLENPRSHPNRAAHTFDLDATYKVVEGNAYIVDNTGTYTNNVFRDDGTGGPFTASSGTSNWLRSAGAPWYGPDPPRSMYTTTSGATASWVPDLPASGDYEVFVWYTTSGARDRNAPYQVVHSSGVSWFSMDQMENGGQWNSLGTFHFNMHGNDHGPSGVTVVRFKPGVAIPDLEHEHPFGDGTDHGEHTCADAVAFVPVIGGTVRVRNAHYYVLADDNGNGVHDSGETVYLVNLNHDSQTIEYYQVLTEGEVLGTGDLLFVPEEEVAVLARPRNPDGSFRTYQQERQNFADWYSFYRRRQHTSIAAMSRTIYDLSNVYVAFRSLQGDMMLPIVPIRVQGENQMSDVLDMLYEYTQRAVGTPLRNALRFAGQYLDQTDSNHGGLGSTSPWLPLEEGGNCQQAFAILMTDGYWNGPSPNLPGGGNIDGGMGSPYADTFNNTLADVAMHYYHRDLVPDLPNDVPTNPYDQANWQHMVTYGVSFGLHGTLDPNHNPATGRPYDVWSENTIDHPIWPNPHTGSQERKIDDLWHASVNGRGEFLSASNPDQLIQNFKDIMESIQARQGSASSVSVNGDQLYTTLGEHTRMFQARYNAGTMTGDVMGFPLYLGGDDQTVPVRRAPLFAAENREVSPDPCWRVGEVLMNYPVWSAAGLLDHRVSNQGHSDRVIITRKLEHSGVGGGIPFTYSAISTSGTTTQLEYLTPDWSASAAASTENLINYLRGDQTHELNVGPFRDRVSLLADIVSSSPTFHKNILYVGGNDGMLHALDAGTGDELFAYVPGLVYENLKEFCNPAYRHKFYVDQTPSVREKVDFNGTLKTVLIGGLGKGGRGYYALDITGLSGSTSYWGQTPSSVLGENETQMAERVLWEFPHMGDPAYEEIVEDMGYSFSNTVITRTYSEDYPWVVIFGNGYNSENSNAVLFIVDIRDGTLIHKIDTGVGNCNGLSTPARVDANLDGKVNYVYAGDLQGNLWKFNLTSSDYNNWNVAYAYDGVPKPLFQARGPVGPHGTLQPITTRPDVMYHPEEHGFMVIFGTGRYLGASDLGDESVQSIYGIWDYGDDEDPTEYLGAFLRGEVPQLSAPYLDHEVYLLEQTFTEHTYAVYGECVPGGYREEILRVLSANEADWTVTTTPDDGVTCGYHPESDTPCDPWPPGENPDPLRTAGWYMDLRAQGEAGTGERMITTPMIRLGTLTYISFQPTDDVCGGEGESDVFQVDPRTGGSLGRPVFDINNDGLIDEDDLIYIEGVGYVAPSSRRFTGRLQSPAIVRTSREIERMYMSSSTGEISQVDTEAARMGITFWKDMMQE